MKTKMLDVPIFYKNLHEYISFLNCALVAKDHSAEGTTNKYALVEDT